MGFFSKLKQKLGSKSDYEILEEAEGEGYVELGVEGKGSAGSKIIVRPFVLDNFESIKNVIDAMREGHTIALVNIKPLKDKDLVELKRAINKLKKTCDAVEGDIAGFGEDWIAVVPSFAHIHRGKTEEQKHEVSEVTEFSEAEEKEST